MMGRGYLPRAAAQARVEAGIQDLRVDLARFVVAIANFKGYRPNGGGAVTISKGTRVRSNESIVVKYPDKFRPLSEQEIERTVASWRRRWRAGAGL
jgi:hypothetical protein